jgi:spermidine/putrescine transport system substrate-binding protein
MTYRRQFLKGITTLSSLSLASCGWRLGNVRAYSATKGPRDQLYIYTWEQYTDQELFKTYNAQTGIKVLADVYDSNETMLSKVQAGGGGAYSVIYPSDYVVRKMVNLGLLTQLNHERLIGLDNFFHVFKILAMTLIIATVYLLIGEQLVLFIIPKKLKTPPEDWDFLWQNQEQLSKQMTLMNDVREVMGAVLRC